MKQESAVPDLSGRNKSHAALKVISHFMLSVDPNRTFREFFVIIGKPQIIVLVDGYANNVSSSEGLEGVRSIFGTVVGPRE